MKYFSPRLLLICLVSKFASSAPIIIVAKEIATPQNTTSQSDVRTLTREEWEQLQKQDELESGYGESDEENSSNENSPVQILSAKTMTENQRRDIPRIYNETEKSNKLEQLVENYNEGKQTTKATTTPLEEARTTEAFLPKFFRIVNGFDVGFERDGKFRVGSRKGLEVIGLPIRTDQGVNIEGIERWTYGKQRHFGPLKFSNDYSLDFKVIHDLLATVQRIGKQLSEPST